MRYIGLLLGVLLVGCEFFKPKEIVTEPPVATVLDNALYTSDLTGLFPPNINAEDSVKLAEKYVEDWIKKQLMISKASDEISYNEAEIERKVLDYRYALIVHAFERKYINSNLNEEVIEQEVLDYYEERADNFLLKQCIIKGAFVQVPSTAPNISRFRNDFKNYPNTDMEAVQSYLSQFATKSFMEDSVWVIFDEVILGTPLENLEDKNQFLQKTSFSETSDDNYIYFLKILDYKISDEISPLEFIRDDIENIIINKRKIALKKELEEKIYEEAKASGLFEVYRK